MESTVDRLDRLIETRTAELCVRSWQSREEIRDAIAIPAEALIESVTDPNPETVARFRANVDRRVKAAYDDPDCSLSAAQDVLDDG
jgi:hypothetical protein